MPATNRRGGVATRVSASTGFLFLGLCFSQVQSLPQVRVPGTRQARHFGGPPTRKSPPLLVSSIKPGKSHSTFLPPWQPGAVKQHDYS